jgi:hypothetical protein
MKIKRFAALFEEWFTTIKNRNYRDLQMDIFVNPSYGDFIGIKQFRWVAFEKSGKMYAAQAEVMHEDIALTARRAGEKGLCIFGTGSASKGKVHYYFVEEETLYPSDDGYYMDSYYIGPKFYDYDWKFMDKWIPNFMKDLLLQKDDVIEAKAKYDARGDDDEDEIHPEHEVKF